MCVSQLLVEPPSILLLVVVVVESRRTAPPTSAHSYSAVWRKRPWSVPSINTVYMKYESMSTSSVRSMYSSETHMNRIQLESLDCIRAGQWRAIFLDSGAVANIVNSSTGSGCCQANREFRGEIHVLATILCTYKYIKLEH